jgi:NAD(P)H dehydrogenase (quinone)
VVLYPVCGARHHKPSRRVTLRLAGAVATGAQDGGLPAAQLKQFLDQCGPLWRAGTLKDKVVTSFTSTQNPHGGRESTILALNNAFYHWGSLIVPPDSTDPIVIAAGGNPYGTSYCTGPPGEDDGQVPERFLAAARAQGRRLAPYASLLAPSPG